MRWWRNSSLFLAVLVLAPWGALAGQGPHEIITTVNKTATSSAVSSDAVLWTPASGKRVAVMGCAVSSGAAQQTLLEINNAAILPVIYTAADTNYQTQGTWPIATGATDQTVTYTTTSGTTTTINCWGYEFQG